MSVVALLPVPGNAEAAWERYAALARDWAESGDIRVDLEANKRLARAWQEWRDLFLALDNRC
ncbi:hypothetical protein J2X47_001991 [Sphingomonas sp. BE270]|jgi:hypothetical protein|uniref:hypothetical protein n=1 Tax=Sphingomonas sp. BE270 TaxID=2817726 RepID=UPI002863143A|nr:hypothetical protein [Sphingomonas sp. BE270]MDR7257811.1 hypothetical protein [Sphingomonas sp. BE270]